MHTAQAVHTGISRARALFESVLAQICSAAPGPQAVFDPCDDVLMLANPAFIAEFGCIPTSRADFERGFEPVVAPTEAPPSEYDCAGGQRVELFCPRTGRWYSFHWSRLRAPDGAELLMLNAQNLTERMDTLRQQRALQEQLLSSSRVMSVGEMATTLAHEINQPLATIVNCLTTARTLLTQRAASSQRLRLALDLAYDQAGQAAAVVARLREFVKTREPRRESLPLRTLVEHVVQLQELDAQKHRVRVAIDLAADLPNVLVDRVMVEQVLANLIRNAIEAMRTTRPADRKLSIGAQLDIEGKIAVRVADRGPGISTAEETHLFTPFFTTKENGMGIGLAICRSIIEYHEGHLYFERNPGGGSVFAFTLRPVPAS